jgi:hypothetical protein
VAKKNLATFVIFEITPIVNNLVTIGSLVYFSRFGMWYQEKSGNPALAP